MTDTDQTNEARSATCAFTRIDGSHCTGAVENLDRGLCFWHDTDAPKDGPDVKGRLETWADTGQSMEGFHLHHAALEGVKLSNRKSTDLRKVDFFRANLHGASLYHTDLREAQLTKADLSGANLNEAKMENVDLLGAILDGARLERVDWGDLAINEKRANAALRKGQREEAAARLEEAEEVYRSLRRAYAARSDGHNAGLFFRREMATRRRQMPPWSIGRAWSRLIDLVCAYGESPPRVIVSCIAFILLCGVAYFFLGILGPEGQARFDSGAGLAVNLEALAECVYYSVVSFTSLGYSDEARQTWLVRPIAGAQAFMGQFMMALFVVVFGKRMTRS